MDAQAGNTIIEVRVERPLRPRNADWHMRSEDGSFEATGQPSPELRKAMGDQARMYARVAVGAGTVSFIEKINRSWR